MEFLGSCLTIILETEGSRVGHQRGWEVNSWNPKFRTGQKAQNLHMILMIMAMMITTILVPSRRRSNPRDVKLEFVCIFVNVGQSKVVKFVGICLRNPVYSST
jgi:hypothetical protein